MQIACPNCATCYEVEASSIGGAGRSVRCARCQNTWFISPTALTVVGASEAALSDLAVAAFRAELGPEPPPSAGTLPLDVAADIVIADAPATAPTDIAALPAPANWPLATTDGATEESNSAVALPMVVVEAPIHSDTERAPAVDLDAGRPPLVIDEVPPAAAPSVVASLPEETPAPDDISDIKPIAPGRPRRTFRRLPPVQPPSNRKLAGVIVLLLAVIGALIGFRGEVVRHAPQMASLYAAIKLPVNVRKVAFADVRSASEMRDGVPVLLVEGTIVSTSAAPTKIPELRFALRNDSGAEVYSWTATPPQAELAPFEALSFHSRLASPPGDGRDIVVRFVNGRDVVAKLD